MQYEDIIKLVREVSKAGLAHFEYTEGNIHIVMGCQEKGTEKEESVKEETLKESREVSHTPAEEIRETDIEEVSENKAQPRGEMVKSPLVGTFYTSPAQDAVPYVKVGDHVTKGQCIGIVEAMKLMNEIESDYTGVVTAILAENGDPVEYGQPLICVDREG